MTQELKFSVVLDDSSFVPAAARTKAGLEGLNRTIASQDAQWRASGASIGQYNNAMRMLPAQLSDVVTQLAGGQSPLLVLTQQGLQTRDMFGSFSAAARGVASVLTPLTVGIGAVATGVGLLAGAAYSGYTEVDKLTRSLAINGNAAGLALSQYQSLSRGIAEATGTTMGDAREALASVAATGLFAGENLRLAGEAAAGMSRLTGKSADEMAQYLGRMTDDVAKWAAEANRSYNFLDVATYKRIKALQDQGRQEEAIKLALETLSGTIDNRAVPAMGSLERAIDAVKRAGAGFWDWLKGIGRPESLGDQLDTVTRQLQQMEAGLVNFRGDSARRQQIDQEINRLRTLQSSLASDLRAEQRMADQSASRAAQNRQQVDAEAKADAEAKSNARGLLAEQRRQTEAGLALQAAGEQQSLARLQLSGEAKLRELEQQYQQQQITAVQYMREAERIALQRADAEIAAARQAEERAGARPQRNETEALQRRAAIVQAQTQVLKAEAARAKLVDEIASGKLALPQRGAADSDAAEQFRALERQQSAAVEKAYSDRSVRAASAAADLLTINRDLSVQLIQDDRARAYAQLELEERAMRERIDLGALSVSERQQAEEDLAAWRVLREEQVTQQLMPQWQRQAQLWADTTRDMARRYDEFLGGFVDKGRDAFQQFLETGQITTRGLTSFIRAEFAKLAYERFLSQYVQKAGNWLFDVLIGSATGGSAPTGGAGGQNPTGGLANGGPMAPLTSWIVGERGPERVVMGRGASGVVVPNSGAQAGGAVVQVTQHFTLRGNEDVGTLYQFAAMAKQAAMAGVAEARARGNPAFVGA